MSTRSLLEVGFSGMHPISVNDENGKEELQNFDGHGSLKNKKLVKVKSCNFIRFYDARKCRRI